jgi:hypothetical protein
MFECLPDLPRYIRQRGDEWHGADHQNGPWRPIPAPQSGLPWPTDGSAVQSREPASVVAEASPLSPAAQAVLDAFWKQPGDRSAIAAAFRAVADRAEDLIGDTEHPKFAKGVLAVAHFLDLIAAEMERANG